MKRILFNHFSSTEPRYCLAASKESQGDAEKSAGTTIPKEEEEQPVRWRADISDQGTVEGRQP